MALPHVPGARECNSIGLTLVVLGAKVFDLPMGAAGGMLAGSG